MHKTQNRYPTCTCTIFAFLQKRKKEIKYTYVYNISVFVFAEICIYILCSSTKEKKGTRNWFCSNKNGRDTYGIEIWALIIDRSNTVLPKFDVALIFGVTCYQIIHKPSHDTHVLKSIVLYNYIPAIRPCSNF